MLAFSSATQGFWLVKNKTWETIVLLICALTFFRPDFWLNQVSEPYTKYQPAQIYQVIDDQQLSNLRVRVEGYSLDGDLVKKTVVLPLPDQGSAQERIEAIGLDLDFVDDGAEVAMVGFDSPASKAGIDFGWKILDVEVKADRLPDWVFYLPALALLILIYRLQQSRSRQAS